MGGKRGLWILLGSLLLIVPLFADKDRVPSGFQDTKGVEEFRNSWCVLGPITRENLSIFPIVSKTAIDTSAFMTLDEGVASGVVKIAERGQIESPIYRRRDSRRPPDYPIPAPQQGGPSVNELVLVNESSRPLILLAGEVVSGGKQNRIIGADLVVPPKSDPVPLSVFCVEHGRWTPGGGAFSSAKTIAHPSIRMQAQVQESQQGVWDSVGGSYGGPVAASRTQNYLDVLNAPEVKRDLDTAARSIETEYDRELRDKISGRGAVGVVVAIKGDLVWSDVFPSADLFAKYWPKLLRSYILEARTNRREVKQSPSMKAAEAFLFDTRGHVTIELEPGAYRRTKIANDDYQVVALEALSKSEESGLLLHYNKMTRS